MTEQTITTVDFKEVPAAVKDPVTYLTEALRASGYAQPEAWTKDIDPAAKDLTVDIDHRLFLVNRALGLYLSETKDCGDNIIPRMFISERQTFENWCLIVNDGIVPWLNKKFAPKSTVVPNPVMVTPGEEVGALISGESLEITADPEADQQAALDAEDFTSSTEPTNIADKINAMTPEARNSNVVTDYKVGQVVVLKSGGPEMTVTNVDDDDDTLACEWVDDAGVKQSHHFAKETVTWPRGKTPSIQHID